MGYMPYGFGALTDQNAASNQMRADAPTMPGYAGIDRLAFADMRTPEDQIHWLYLYAKQLDESFITKDEAQELVDAAIAALRTYVDAQDAALDGKIAGNDAAVRADMKRMYDYLVALINSLTEFTGMTFDPTYGASRSIRTVVERTYAFDRVFGRQARDYGNQTAAQLDGYGATAREYDVMMAIIAYGGE